MTINIIMFLTQNNHNSCVKSCVKYNVHIITCKFVAECKCDNIAISLELRCTYKR